MTNKTASSASTQNDEWATLMGLAQAGDKKAYRQLLNVIFPYIRNRLFGKISHADAVDDIAQEVLVSVHKSMQTYSTDRPFKPWLNAIISYRQTDHLRKVYRQAPEQVTDFTENQDFFNTDVTDPTLAGEYKDIEAAMDSLPEQQKVAVKLMRIDGYTAEETASETGMSVSAVKVNVHRATKKLKQALGYHD